MDGLPEQRPNKPRSVEEWEGILKDALPGFCCRACGGGEWHAEAAGEGLVGVLHQAKWPSGKLKGTLPTVPFVCVDCGLTELFSEYELLKRVGKTINE